MRQVRMVMACTLSTRPSRSAWDECLAPNCKPGNVSLTR